MGAEADAEIDAADEIVSFLGLGCWELMREDFRSGLSGDGRRVVGVWRDCIVADIVERKESFDGGRNW